MSIMATITDNPLDWFMHSSSSYDSRQDAIDALIRMIDFYAGHGYAVVWYFYE